MQTKICICQRRNKIFQNAFFFLAARFCITETDPSAFAFLDFLLLFFHVLAIVRWISDTNHNRCIRLDLLRSLMLLTEFFRLSGRRPGAFA